MITVPPGVVVVALRAMRANRTFTTEEGARRRVREATLRPAPYGPPSRLRRRVRVDVTRRDGWPVYTIRPTSTRATGGVVYVHGGGWVNEIAPQHWALAARIAEEGATVVTLPIYPLIPYGTAGATVQGVEALVRSSTGEFGPTSLAGDSAGGQIALSAALRLRDAGTVLPRLTLIAPALDLSWSNPAIPLVQPSDPWLGVPGGRVLSRLWQGDLDVRDPDVSPLFGDPTGLGPVTLLVGTRDVLNPDAHAFVAKARAAGVEVDFHEAAGEVHVYPLTPTAAGARGAQVVVDGLRAGGRRE